MGPGYLLAIYGQVEGWPGMPKSLGTRSILARLCPHNAVLLYSRVLWCPGIKFVLRGPPCTMAARTRAGGVLTLFALLMMVLLPRAHAQVRHLFAVVICLFVRHSARFSPSCATGLERGHRIAVLWPLRCMTMSQSMCQHYPCAHIYACKGCHPIRCLGFSSIHAFSCILVKALLHQ